MFLVPYQLGELKFSLTTLHCLSDVLTLQNLNLLLYF